MSHSLDTRSFFEAPPAFGAPSTLSSSNAPVPGTKDKANDFHSCRVYANDVSPKRRLVFLDLPTEIHLSVLDLLDRIDSTCLGLTNHYFYAIHHRRHGAVPLSAGRDGPNDLEWAWRFATRPLCEAKSGEKPARRNEETPEGAERPRCRMCGVTRCELARHVRDWMPDGLEYCAVSDRYGPPASSGASSYCRKWSPRHRRRCGRHHPRKWDAALAEGTPVQPGSEGATMDAAVKDEKHSMMVDVQEFLLLSRVSVPNQRQE